MGKQNSTLTVVGKVGNMVGYKGRGKTLARIRQTDVKYSNTEAQAIQRMITATNARAYSRLKEICDHSFEGVAYRQLSQDYFLKQNAKILRQWVADNYPTITESDPSNYVGLSGKSDGFAAGVGLLISKGTIPSIPVHRSDEFIHYFGSEIIGTGGDTPNLGNVLNALGIQPGDQLTLVALIKGAVSYSRYVFRTDITDTQKALTFSSSNLAQIITAESIIGSAKLQIVTTNDEVTNFRWGMYIEVDGQSWDELGVGCMGLAMIISRKAADGTWLRSTQRLIWAGDSDVAGLESPEYCIEEWTAGTTQINTSNRWYLNQAQNS